MRRSGFASHSTGLWVDVDSDCDDRMIAFDFEIGISILIRKT